MKTRRTYLAVAIAVGLFLAVAPGRAAIVADFDDGNTGALVDGYPGTPGNGWANDWQEPTSGGTYTAGPTVALAAPLSPAGGNYLTATYDVSAANGQATVSRQYTNSGGVALDQAHTVQFQFRVEDLTNFTDNEDRLFLFDRTGPRFGTDSACSWIITAAGDTRTGSNWNALEWTFFDGDKSGGGYYGDNFVNTGVPLAAGVTYDVTVDVRPADKEWDATITDGTHTYSHSGLGYRIDATTVGGHLNFGGRGSAANDERSFSLDAIRIVPVVIPTAIEADFTDGNGDTAVDQFRGKPGGGWTTQWQVKGNGNVDVTKNITPPTEVRMPSDAGFSEVVPGAGPYLDVSMKHKNNSNNGQAAITRPYGEYGVVDPTGPHTVQFVLRIDESLGGTSPFANAEWDQYFVFDATGLKHGYSESNDASWLIVARGESASRTGNWYLYDGPGDGQPVDTSRLIDTGMSLGSGGGTYSFAVQADPAAGTYDVAISDGSIGRVWTGLGFQKAANEVGQYVTFGSRGNRAADHREFSLDLLRIDPPARQVVANFTDGNGADHVDQFVGRPGNGWVTPWSIKGSSPTAGLTGQVVSTNPLSPGGGEYLSATFQRINSGGQATFNRMYLGEFGLARPQEIRFQYRHDSSLDNFGDHDRVVFFEDARALHTTSSSNRWLIFADGGLFDRNWIVYDGNQGGDRPGAAGRVDSGIRLEEGHVYEFAIQMDPLARLWDVIIHDETAGLTYNSAQALPDHLGFRTGVAHAGGTLNFGGEIDAGERMLFSLDSIRVVEIPEPGTAALLGLAAAAIGRYVRRRRRLADGG